MRAWLGAGIILAIAGCSRPIAPGAVFGSTPEFSTVPGFAVGTWLHRRDETNARNPMGQVGDAISAILPEYLMIDADGRYTYAWIGHEGNGRWSSDGRSIDLTLMNVDGLDLQQVERDAQRYSELPVRGWIARFRRQNHQAWLDRGTVRDMAIHIERLTIDPDGRRLDQPGATVNADGTTFLGSDVWVRVKK